MRKKAIPVYVFLALMVVVCAAYFAVQSGLFKPEPPAGGQSGQSGQSEQTESAVYRQPASSIAQEDLPDMYRYVPRGEPLPKPDVFAEDYTATVDGFRIKVNDVYVAKDTQGLPYPRYLSERNGETVDENGTLTSAHSYLFMEITVENQTQLSRTFSTAMSRPVFYAGEKYLYMDASLELAMQSINNDASEKSYYEYMMKAGETVTYTRAYIFPDEGLEQVTDLYLPVTFGSKILVKSDNSKAWNPAAVMLDLTPLWPGDGKE